MKPFNQLALSCACIFSIFSFACSPDNVNPSQEKAEAGAYTMSDAHGFPPSYLCQPVFEFPMVSETYGSNVVLGTCYIAQNADIVMLLEKAVSGLAFTACYVNGGLGSEPIVISPEGTVDCSSFAYGGPLDQPLSAYLLTIPIEKLEEHNLFTIYSKVNAVDVSGNVLFADGVWAFGKSGAVGYYIDFTNIMCDNQTVAKWSTGLPKCLVPTGIGPNGNLSAYARMGGKKYAICHLPPGNPANIQNIEIGKDALAAHIVDFKPLDNPCLGHHSGCHLGECDPCGAGSSLDAARKIEGQCPGN